MAQLILKKLFGTREKGRRLLMNKTKNFDEAVRILEAQCKKEPEFLAKIKEAYEESPRPAVLEFIKILETTHPEIDVENGNPFTKGDGYLLEVYRVPNGKTLNDFKDKSKLMPPENWGVYPNEKDPEDRLFLWQITLDEDEE